MGLLLLGQIAHREVMQECQRGVLHITCRTLQHVVNDLQDHLSKRYQKKMGCCNMLFCSKKAHTNPCLIRMAKQKIMGFFCYRLVLLHSLQEDYQPRHVLVEAPKQKASHHLFLMCGRNASKAM